LIDEMLDDEQQEEIHDYFMESESDKIEGALKEFEGDYDIDELRLMRIKYKRSSELEKKIRLKKF
jgi:ATP-dependent DNA helicase RecQ